MRTVAKLTSKGQVVIPKPVRERLRWRKGTCLDVEVRADGSVLLARRGRVQVGLDEILDQMIGLVATGDPVEALEAEHQQEISADRRDGQRRRG